MIFSILIVIFLCFITPGWSLLFFTTFLCFFKLICFVDFWVLWFSHSLQEKMFQFDEIVSQQRVWNIEVSSRKQENMLSGWNRIKYKYGLQGWLCIKPYQPTGIKPFLVHKVKTCFLNLVIVFLWMDECFSSVCVCVPHAWQVVTEARREHWICLELLLDVNCYGSVQNRTLVLWKDNKFLN